MRQVINAFTSLLVEGGEGHLRVQHGVPLSGNCTSGAASRRLDAPAASQPTSHQLVEGCTRNIK